MENNPREPGLALEGTETPRPPRAGGIEQTQIASEAMRVRMPERSEGCLVNIYPTGPGMGARHKIEKKSLFLGRGDDCDIHIDDSSASRRHAEIRPGLSSNYVIDLQSTNGTFVNDKKISVHKLEDGDYVRIGNWIFRYLAGGNIESQYHEEIHRLAIVDGLTGIHNKRALLEFVEREVSRSIRHQRPLSLIIFDIDRFKAINDSLGHLAGDYALRELAGCVKGAVGPEQMFARYGGEEFVLVLPEMEQSAAVKLAEEQRKVVENHPFQFDGKSFAVTISLGVVTTDGDDKLTSQELIRRADEKLYKAKHNGRNCVVA